jgi:hypothetical protein
MKSVFTPEFLVVKKEAAIIKSGPLPSMPPIW